MWCCKEKRSSAVYRNDVSQRQKKETWNGSKSLLFSSLKKVLDILNDLLSGLRLLLKPCCVKAKVLIENRMY